jgi:hypothetical protein
MTTRALAITPPPATTCGDPGVHLLLQQVGMAGIDRDLSRPDPLVAVFVRRDLRTFSWRLCPASSWPCTCLACSPPACSPQAYTYSCVTGVPAGSARRGSTVVVDNRRRELLRPRGRAEALAVLAALLMLALWPVRRRAILPQGRCQPNEAPPSRAATVDAPAERVLPFVTTAAATVPCWCSHTVGALTSGSGHGCTDRCRATRAWSHGICPA